MDQVIRRAQDGDQTAFAELFERYQRLVLRTAFLIVGNADEADDALQEVFLRVHRALGSFDPTRAAFSTWLHQITVNYCLNMKRRRSALQLRLGEDDAEPIQAGAPLDERFGMEDEVTRALAKLSDKLRAAVVLRYYNDLSYEEIARILDIPTGTVKSRLDQSMRILRRELRSADSPAGFAPIPEKGAVR